MSDDLRAAAQRALLDRGESGASGEITRVTLDVSVEGRSEIVTLMVKDGALRWSSTGDADGGPHLAAALKFVATGEASPTAVVVSSPEALDAKARVSWPPAEAPVIDDADGPSARARLADALEDVVTAIVRAGTNASTSPSVSESLERLRKEAPLPCPLGLARWLGRLREALERSDPRPTAHLLDGASQLVRALRKNRPTRNARRHVGAWLGTSGDLKVTEQLSDRTLIEVAREWLRTSDRSGVERRYLVDIHNGEIFREERDRTTTRTSIGPCPRRVYVGLGEVEDGASPRRIRPMQYEVTLDVSREDLSRVEASGCRRFAALADRYREQLEAAPGQAEPFAVVIPKRWETDAEGPRALDDEGTPLPFARADDPAAVDVLRELSPRAGPRWIAGRLVDVAGSLMMVPCSFAVSDGEDMRIHRLR